tara:strand:+ start:1797 stop:2654 length:858 start_codon:yes stop_codon:yes gene_type:complete
MSETNKDYDVFIRINELGLTIDVPKKCFNISDVSDVEAVKFIKGFYRNRQEFMDKFINKIKHVYNSDGYPFEFDDSESDFKAFDTIPQSHIDDFQSSKHEFVCDDFLDKLVEIYDSVEEFTYREAFKLKNVDFQARVFGTIDVSDMITNLGHERVATDGKLVKHKKYDINGNFLCHEEYDVIYETHKVNGEKLGIQNESLYALKCWCTSTDEEHWIWIEEQYKDEPLEAVASTFRIHENLIDNIKEIKRQGDILMVEMIDDNIKPEGNIVPLNADKYFSLLTAQS